MAQPTVTLELNDSKSMRLTKALLIYEGAQNFASLHQVAMIEGRATILSGKALTAQASWRLARSLGRKQTKPGLLPANILAVTNGALMWHEAPQVRHLAFRNDESALRASIGTRGGRAPLPGLIFTVDRHRWCVYAHVEKGRPVASTRLYRAPFFNVYEDGAICVGNVRTPGSVEPGAIAGWNEAFFGSHFTHANHEQLVRFEGGSGAFWNAALSGVFGEAFPNEVLIEDGRYLGDLVEALA